MKTIRMIPWLLGSLVMASSLPAANTLTVDNRPGAVAMHATFADAYAAASPGDTILMAGSATQYEVGVIAKRLHIRGPGWFKAELNLDEVNLAASRISEIRFDAGSDGSTIAGVSIEDDLTGGLINTGVTNVRFDQILFGPAFFTQKVRAVSQDATSGVGD